MVVFAPSLYRLATGAAFYLDITTVYDSKAQLLISSAIPTYTFGKDVVNSIGGIIGSETGVMVCHHGVVLGFVDTKYSHKHHSLFMILGSKKPGSKSVRRSV